MASLTDRAKGMTMDNVLSAEDYSTVFHLWPDMFCLADSNGVFLDVNPACERILGFNREELIGKNWETYVHPDDIALTREEVARQLRGQKVLNFMNRYRSKSGAYKYIQWQGIVTDSKCLVGIGRDITDEVRRAELLAKVAQSERNSLSASLHDGISQQLFGLRMIASQLRQSLAKEGSFLAPRAALMEEIVHETLRSVKNVMEGLSPCGENPGCLSQSLQTFSDRIGNLYDVRCVYELEEPAIQVSSEVANQLCLIAQEAVMNAVRHSAAKQIVISSKRRDGELELCVADDGVGINGKRMKPGFGMSIMRDRASLIDASLDITGNSNGGTTVRCVWKDPAHSV